MPDAGLSPAAKTSTSPADYKVAPPPIYFTITIEGPGMQPRTQTWNAYEVGGKTVVPDNIPSGSGRLFTGRLIQGSVRTHEGSYTTDIRGGESVFVPLVLRDVRTGKAEICVEVEGWPGSGKCAPIDTVPGNYFSINGCWQLGGYGLDSTLVGTLSLSEYANSVSGCFRGKGGNAMYVSCIFKNQVWNLSFVDEIVFIDYMLSVAGKAMPGDTLIHPIDPIMPWHPSPTLYVKVDNTALAYMDFVTPSGPVLTVWVTDSTFTSNLGYVVGRGAKCEIEPPIDTLPHIFVDTVMIDVLP